MCMVAEKRSRWQRALANGALAAGLGLWSFARPAIGSGRPWFDAVVGVLMGVSIGMNLMLVWKMRRRSADTRGI
jgi:hypothetical protein